ncbi:MAG: diacylglycerol kinase family protein [Mycoplasma sp.]|nr:diacylglycerol kinase family protein [Mycoplasma sp.]
MKEFFQKVTRKFYYASKGIWITVREEKSLWTDIIFAIIVIALGIWLKIDRIEWSIIIISISLVMGFEILNTSIEALVDMISFQYNLKVKKIKDIAAGATLLVSIAAVIIGCLIFIPQIIDKFQ